MLGKTYWKVLKIVVEMMVAMRSLWDEAIYLIPMIFAGLLPLVYYLMGKARSNHVR